MVEHVGIVLDLLRLRFLADHEGLGELELLTVILEQRALHDDLQMFILLFDSLVQAQVKPQNELLVFIQFHEASKGTFLDLRCIRAHLNS